MCIGKQCVKTVKKFLMITFKPTISLIKQTMHTIVNIILSLSLIIISSVDNRVTKHFIKLKVHQLQFFINLSNINAINNTHYMVFCYLKSMLLLKPMLDTVNYKSYMGEKVRGSFDFIIM